MKTQLVKIIENLVAGDNAKAIAYAELLIRNAENKYRRTGNIFDKYEIMTARNVMHVLKGEPKEGGVAVCDSARRSADNLDRVARGLGMYGYY